MAGLLTSSSTFYVSNETKPLLLLADGAYLEDLARADHLGGGQRGMMNETGDYPGQPWMWLDPFLYQVKPFSPPATPSGCRRDCGFNGTSLTAAA